MLVPTGNEKITEDSSPPTGLKVYQQLFQSAVGLASATQNFDGNGRYLRATVGGGANQVQTHRARQRRVAVRQRRAAAAGHAARRSRHPARPRPLDGKVPCYTQTPPNLNSAAQGSAP